VMKLDHVPNARASCSKNKVKQWHGFVQHVMWNLEQN